MSDHIIKTWRCDCGCPTFITVGMWRDEGDGYGYISIEEYGRELDWKDRIKHAWKILRGQSVVMSELLLTKPVVEELNQTFSELWTDYVTENIK
jgi:hypothetical protein